MLRRVSISAYLETLDLRPDMNLQGCSNSTHRGTHRNAVRRNSKTSLRFQPDCSPPEQTLSLLVAQLSELHSRPPYSTVSGRSHYQKISNRMHVRPCSGFCTQVRSFSRCAPRRPSSRDSLALGRAGKRSSRGWHQLKRSASEVAKWLYGHCARWNRLKGTECPRTLWRSTVCGTVSTHLNIRLCLADTVGAMAGRIRFVYHPRLISAPFV